MTDGKVHVHAESLRAGIKACWVATHGAYPVDQVVEQIVSQFTQMCVLHEFPIMSVLNGVADRRRMYATKAMEVLMVRTPMEHITNEELDALVEKAWHIASAMERQDGTAQQLDSLSSMPRSTPRAPR